MQCFLAIDSGGTKCETLAFSSEGKILGTGRCDGSEVSERTVSGKGRSEECMLKAAKQALGTLDYTELIVGGSIPCSLAGVSAFIRVPEHMAAFALLKKESGLVALAGTGALVYGKRGDGMECFLDGIGPILGDCGSAYQVGLMALRAAAKSGWNARHKTSLEQVIKNECGGETVGEYPSGLVEWSLSDLDRSEIASLARLVDAEAANGDEISRKILMEAASDLSETVRDVVDRLDMRSEDALMIGTGGLNVNSNLYWEFLSSKVQEFAPRIVPVRSDLPPVVGIATVMLQESRFPEVEESITNLRSGCKATP